MTSGSSIPSVVFAAGTNSGVDDTTLVDSFDNFTQLFGPFNSKEILHVAIRAYFDNGGSTCYVIPINKWDSTIPDLDVNLLVAAGQDIVKQALQLCAEDKFRFAILDGPAGDLENLVEHFPSTSHAAMYYPWLVADWAGTSIPPSAAVAGIYCTVDSRYGPWKVPAQDLKGSLQTTRSISLEEMQINSRVNMIQSFNEGIPRIMGAHTLESNLESPWRHVRVRRFCDKVQTDTRNKLVSINFKPNNAVIRTATASALYTMLFDLWKEGALLGLSVDQAYYVHVGKNMSESDSQEGLLKVEIGLAVMRPCEFIHFVFTQNFLMSG